jgi:NADPH:quinone reductase-like Zn-dependent oxidoreductase
VQDRYGGDDVLQLREVDRPVVQPDEVLVRVRAASVHPDVWHVVRGQPLVLRLMGSGLRRPKKTIPGTDVAGIIEEVGSAVTALKPGDEVFGETTRSYQWANGGAFAEYVAIPQELLALKPPNVSFEQAASVPTAGIIALQNLLILGGLKAGHRVLVNGAAGGVGSIAVQVAKAQGAHVTGVEHTEKLDLVRSLGADRVIDYTRDDFTQGSERYDLIFDVPGNHSFPGTIRCRRAGVCSARPANMC